MKLAAFFPIQWKSSNFRLWQAYRRIAFCNRPGRGEASREFVFAMNRVAYLGKLRNMIGARVKVRKRPTPPAMVMSVEPDKGDPSHEPISEAKAVQNATVTTTTLSSPKTCQSAPGGADTLTEVVIALAVIWFLHR
jgi:hypothetical protein